MEVVDEYKWMRPLSHASLIGYVDGVHNILIKSSATAYLAERNGSYMASKKGHVEIHQEFLERCPDSRELLNNKHQNILHLAAKSGRAKAVSYILKNSNLEMLINERDYEGNTALHLATEKAHPKVVSILTWDSRVDLELVNQKAMTALDVAENYKGNVPSFRERLTWQALRYAGARRAPQENKIRTNQDSKLYPEGTPQNMDCYKDRVSTLLLVSILVVTIAFAAGLVSPGNLNTSESKEGTTTLFQECIFHLFVISNTIALYTSITVVVALIWSQLGDLRLVLASLKYTVPVLGVSLAMVSVAFMSGAYLVVRKYTWLPILVLVLGSTGFLVLFALFVPLYSPNSSKHRFARHIFYYPFCLLIKVTKSDVDNNCEEE